MPRRQGDVEAALRAKGFVVGGGDHNYFHYHSKSGKKSRVFTKTSHGAREIDDNLLSMMARQCRLTNKDFALLLDCPLDRDAYEAKLLEQGLIDSLTSGR